MTVELHGYRQSVCSWIARLALHKKRIGYEWVEVNPSADDMPPDYLAMQPFKRLPTLVSGRADDLVAQLSHRSQGPTMQALSQIRQIDYTVIFARNMDAMRHFYETIMEFPLLRALSDRWIEYRVGSTTLALTTHGARFNDMPPEQGALSLQLAFRVAPQAVAECATALEAKGVSLISPLTDHSFGHRTIFFRDPDGNVLEIFAEI